MILRCGSCSASCWGPLDEANRGPESHHGEFGRLHIAFLQRGWTLRVSTLLKKGRREGELAPVTWQRELNRANTLQAETGFLIVTPFFWLWPCSTETGSHAPETELKPEGEKASSRG